MDDHGKDAHGTISSARGQVQTAVTSRGVVGRRRRRRRGGGGVTAPCELPDGTVLRVSRSFRQTVGNEREHRLGE